MRAFLLLFLLFPYAVSKGQGQHSISLFDSLYTYKEIKLSLIYPFDSLYKTKFDEIKAHISIETDQGYLLKDTPMTINLRGKFRRMKCDMPPLLLNFKKSTLHDLQVSDVDEIKLVTHCMNGPEGVKNLEEERLCYQIYEAISPVAYRTVWVSVYYIDAFHPDDTITSKGFLLEPDKVIYSRLGIQEEKKYSVPEDSLQFESYSRTVAFNFLIGNLDWSVVSSRNAKLFYDTTLGKYIVIPYDFDYSNIVNASYRRTTQAAAMSNPLDRRYDGEYFTAKAPDILLQFRDSENQIINAVKTADNTMNEARRNKIIQYLEDWFSQINKRNKSELGFGTIFPYKGTL